MAKSIFISTTYHSFKSNETDLEFITKLKVQMRDEMRLLWLTFSVIYF